METLVQLPATATSQRASGQTGRNNISAFSAGVSQAPFAIAIFLSAFLLFQVQLLLGKQILPLFGGAPAVWTACLLVFQLLLLAGYAHAHGLAAKSSLRGQAAVQVVLLIVSLAALVVLSRSWSTPITPDAAWRPAPDANPVWSIVRFLLTAIGLPFFLLSATSPLLQHWFAEAAPQKSPYRLYALSNVGSLLGLLSYPFLIEPNFRLRTQAWVWIAGYSAFAAAYVFCAFIARRTISAQDSREKRIVAAPVSPASKFAWTFPAQWITLAMCGSVLLLAATNFICQDVAVIPFLWVLPLSLYILSFILCFEGDRWYRREIFHPFFALTAGLVVYVTLPSTSTTPLFQIGVCCALLFAGCMICHGEAARMRPAAGHLTKFFLCIAFGGALGGIFVNLIAPVIFRGYWEFPLGIVACAALLLWTVSRDSNSWWHAGKSWLAAVVSAPAVMLLYRVANNYWSGADKVPERVVWAVAGALACASALLYARRRRSNQPPRPRFVQGSAWLGLGVVVAGLAVPQDGASFRTIAQTRNFYGVLTVIEKQPENYITLCHGKTIHGSQFRAAGFSRIPTGYYGQYSGGNILLQHWPYHPMRVGLVGMGTGSLAALAQFGDVYRFYEINPEILRLSNGEQALFTFTKESLGRIEIVLGDARRSLEDEAARGKLQKFDVLVLDAFSGDAIPMHLLTREAFATYLRHLRGPESAIAVHVSNRALDLGPVLAGIAQEFQLHAIRTHATWLPGVSGKSDWILLSREASSIHTSELQAVAVPYPVGTRAILWTDDYSNLLRVLR